MIALQPKHETTKDSTIVTVIPLIDDSSACLQLTLQLLQDTSKMMSTDTTIKNNVILLYYKYFYLTGNLKAVSFHGDGFFLLSCNRFCTNFYLRIQTKKNLVGKFISHSYF